MQHALLIIQSQCTSIPCRLLILLLITRHCCEAASSIRATGTQLVDEAGRVVVLRGLNLPIDGKTPDFMPLKNSTSLLTLPQYGTSVARVMFVWEAFEPTRGQYNMEYLQYYLGVVESLQELGIMTIVDMHQDTYSRYLNKGCGDGFPKWAILVTPVVEKPPQNGITCTAWQFQAVLDAPGKENWERFFAGQGGVRDRFLDLWEFLAETFTGNPGVLGYDLLNEPNGNEITEIGPLYEDIAARIRKHDPNAIIFIQPQGTTAVGGATHLTQPAFDSYLLEVHYYSYLPQANITAVLTAGIVVPLVEALAGWLNVTTTWNVPLFFGEFGATNDPVKAPPYIDQVYNQLDLHALGGTQWGWTPAWSPATKDGWNEEDYSVVDQDLGMRSNYAIRPYARAVAGIPGPFLVDAGNRTVALSWEVTAATLALRAAHGSQAATTEVFAPAQGFFGVATPAQVAVQASPAGAGLVCAYSADGLSVSCLASQAKRFSLLLQRAVA